VARRSSRAHSDPERGFLGHVPFLRFGSDSGGEDHLEGFASGPHALVVAEWDGPPAIERLVQFGRPERPQSLTLWGASEGGGLTLLTTARAPHAAFAAAFACVGLPQPRLVLFAPVPISRGQPPCFLWACEFPGGHNHLGFALLESLATEGHNDRLRLSLPKWAATAARLAGKLG